MGHLVGPVAMRDDPVPAGRLFPKDVQYVKMIRESVKLYALYNRINSLSYFMILRKWNKV